MAEKGSEQQASRLRPVFVRLESWVLRLTSGGQTRPSRIVCGLAMGFAASFLLAGVVRPFSQDAALLAACAGLAAGLWFGFAWEWDGASRADEEWIANGSRGELPDPRPAWGWGPPPPPRPPVPEWKRVLNVLATTFVFAWVVYGLLAHRPPADGMLWTAAMSTPRVLAPCPDRPNCVSTEAQDERHAIEPIVFDTTPTEAQARLRVVLQSWPRTKVTADEPGYLAATFTSRVFGFPDDAEFLVDAEARVIRFRCASRVGYSDLGVNRRRMEKLRKAFGEPRPGP